MDRATRRDEPRPVSERTTVRFPKPRFPPRGRGGTHLARTLGLSALLYLVAGTGMAYVAGFHTVDERLIHADWAWLGLAAGVVLVGFGGYYVAYRGLYLAEDGPRLSPRMLLALVAAGFGGLLAHGAGTLDRRAVRAAGEGDREAKVRVTALAGFEHGVLAAIVCPAAIAALALGRVIPRADFTWPWAVAPVPGFLLAVWAAGRFRDRLRGRRGLAGSLGVFLDAIHLTVTLFRHPRRTGYAALGMAVYWGADMVAVWAAIAAFGVRLSALSVIAAYGTGMIVTRRTAPLGGAGLLGVALVPSVWYGAAAPFAVATLGVFAYQFLTLWLPLPGSLLVLPVLRTLREGERASEARGAGGQPAPSPSD